MVSPVGGGRVRGAHSQLGGVAYGQVAELGWVSDWRYVAEMVRSPGHVQARLCSRRPAHEGTRMHKHSYIHMLSTVCVMGILHIHKHTHARTHTLHKIIIKKKKS